MTFASAWVSMEPQIGIRGRVAGSVLMRFSVSMEPQIGIRGRAQVNAAVGLETLFQWSPR